MLTKVQTGSTTYSFAYGDFAQRTSVSIGDRLLAAYTYTQDANRYLSALNYGNGDFVQYTYDDHGRVTKETDEDGQTVTYSYDNSGLLATVTDSETGRKITYYYDLIDRLGKYKEVGSNYEHSVAYTYDTRNNLSKLVETINGTEHVTDYTYDEANRVETVTANGITRTYTYDAYGRTTRMEDTQGETSLQTTVYTYHDTAERASTRIATVRTTRGTAVDITYSYTYDGNGNILTISDGTNTTSYVYDTANQLIRENNQGAGRTWTWVYDNAGNITSRKEYAYTTGDLGTPIDTVSYTYGDDSWGDLLTAYDGTTITYDAIGNPLNDGTWTYIWQNGRELASMSNGSTTWNYTYDANGMRTSRSNGTTVYNYVYNGGSLSQMTVGNSTLGFAYDASGVPMMVNYNGTNYYYITNLQGDVTGITDSSGTLVVSYTYDAWGKLLSITGSMAATLGVLNPLRYRSYVYDEDTELYYLQSRYYDPEIGRFINADALVATGQGMLGNNMFAYCRNNPVKRKDASGTDDICVAHADDMDTPLNDLGYTPSGGYANAYNSIDAGYHYGVDFSMASNSSLQTGGIYGNGYTAYGVYSNPTGSGYTSSFTNGVCFIAGTLVHSEDGSKAIEDISAGDKVWAWDEETGDVALKEVVETYINETDELIHVFVNGEEIITTPTHPFYSPAKGWIDACDLRAGDILILVSGEQVTVEKVQHETLETPIVVYNFQVEDYHTYYVTNRGVLVHNSCNKPVSPAKVSESYIKQNQIDAHAFKQYAASVPQKMLSRYDIYKDTANKNVLWVGTKQHTDWRQTKYTFVELTTEWIKD